MRASKVEILHDPIDILSSKFEQHLSQFQGEAKASEMEHAIRHEIRVKLDENPVLYTSLKKKLEELIEARKLKQMDIFEMMEKMQEIMGEMRDAAKQGEHLGLTREQYPIFLMLEKQLPEEENKEALKVLTEVITEKIQELSVIEWTQKDDVKREMRQQTKRQLRVFKCPEDKLESLTIQLVDLVGIHYRK